MPLFDVRIEETHTFETSNVEAATSTEAMMATRAMWNEQRRRGMPDLISEEKVHTHRVRIESGMEDTQEITKALWVGTSNGRARVRHP